MCQSPGTPSVAMYWHMGETTMRFGTVRPRMSMGEKSLAGMVAFHIPIEPQRACGILTFVRELNMPPGG
jgi:hypothetical protein